MLGNVTRPLPAVLIVGVATIVLALVVRPVAIEPAWVIMGGRLASLPLLAAAGALWFAGRTLSAVAAALAGLSWAGVIWSVERVNGADALAAGGMLLGPLLVPLLILLVTGLPDLWLIPDRWTRVLVAAAALIAMAGVGRALVYDPILDLRCGPFCGHSPVVVVANLGLASWLGVAAATTSTLACGAIAAGVLVGRSGRVSGRRVVLPPALAACAMGALSAMAAWSVLRGAAGVAPEELCASAGRPAAASAAIAVAAVLVAWERLAIGRNLARLARLLTGEQGHPTAEALLRDAIGDPGLTIGYWTDERGYVRADGLPLGPAGPGRQRTELTSRGRPIAVVVHDTSVPLSDLVEAHVGPEARLALQNESLELELERRLDELRASRRRVVEAGDAERRQLERDLHDGAQQLLLALSFEVRRGERSAVEAGDDVAAALFVEARVVAGRILEQLRVLAHGIHPTVLTNAGLEPALATYARAMDAPPPLSVEVARRPPPGSEASAYAVVTAPHRSRPGRWEDGIRGPRRGGCHPDRRRGRPRGARPRPRPAGGGGWLVGGRATGTEFLLPCG